MKSSRLGSGLLVAVLIAVTACSGGIQQPINANPQAAPDQIAPAGPALDLPAISTLPKTGSSVVEIDALDYVMAANAIMLFGNPEGLVPLRLKLDPSMAPSPEHEQDHEIGKSSSTHYSYAIYEFDEVGDNTSGIQICTFNSYNTRFWVGFADWDRGVWDFSAGTKIDCPTISLSQFLDQGKQIVSPDGRVAIAVIVEPDTGTAALTKVRRLITDDPSDFSASSDRWDGVDLKWPLNPNIDGYNIFRRLMFPEPGPWVLLNDDVLEENVTEFLDTTALEGHLYEYKLRAGFRSDPNGIWQMSWSNGITDFGKLGAQTVQVDASELRGFWPVTVYNKLGFAFESTATSKVNLAVTDRFPPTELWESERAGENGLNAEQIVSVDGLPPAVTFDNWALYGNQRLTYAYSTDAGSFVQVAFIETDGSKEWTPPVHVREPGTIVLGIFDIPRRMGLITWNTVSEQIEILDSIDQHGTAWYNWDPVSFPWMIASSKKPVGEVEASQRGGSSFLTFQESESNKATVLSFYHNTWTDQSPDIVIGPEPKLRYFMMPPFPGKLALFHLDETQQSIKFITSNLDYNWLTEFPITPINLEGTSSTISEFDIHLFGSVAQLSYLAYIADGNVYLSRCTTTTLLKWESPRLIDDSGDCHDLKIWRIGTDQDFNYRIYATYISDDQEGIQRIHFRELGQAIKFL